MSVPLGPLLHHPDPRTDEHIRCIRVTQKLPFTIMPMETVCQAPLRNLSLSLRIRTWSTACRTRVPHERQSKGSRLLPAHLVWQRTRLMHQIVPARLMTSSRWTPAWKKLAETELLEAVDAPEEAAHALREKSNGVSQAEDVDDVGTKIEQEIQVT